MKNNDWKERLNVVYSTNPDFKYESVEEEAVETLDKKQQKLRVNIEKKGRGGKTVTLINGFIGTENDLKELGKLLKVLRNKLTPLQIVITNGYTCSIFQVAKITIKTEITKKGVWLCSLFCLIPIYLPSYF